MFHRTFPPPQSQQHTIRHPTDPSQHPVPPFAAHSAPPPSPVLLHTPPPIILCQRVQSNTNQPCPHHKDKNRNWNRAPRTTSLVTPPPQRLQWRI
ncbi:hypothetical protein CVT25_014168 [Psilocybe cyanescens]|uniref:Uncharacterized protein n=1 Tax=Psilocybe cyanescens TaxID=93625 RepID=A0A409XUL6_PSICY|nr:hypothetical protein CVT25_014168 [Psilocybe cyanescens]